MRPRRLATALCAAVLALGLTACSGTDLDSAADAYEAELHYEIERAEARQRAAEGRAAAEARAEEMRRVDAARVEAQRLARQANAEALRRNLAAAARERERAEIQELFERGWSTACGQISQAPRASGRVVTFAECMGLVERTDVATLDDAEGFGAWMAEYAVTEWYGA